MPRPSPLRPGLLLAIGLALVAAPLASADPRPAEPGVSVWLDRYRGRWREHPRFEPLFGTLPERARVALARVRDRLGLAPTDPSRIHLHLVDADLGRYGLDRARSWTRGRAGAHEHLVALFTEYYLSGDSDLDTTLCHELTHAVMRERMGPAAYERLPHWVREGLAVFAADEGPHHLRRNLQVEERVEALLTGLMTDDRSLVMYPYAWLAIDLVEGRGGAGAVGRFAQGLVAGGDPATLVQRLTGLAWPHFEVALREHVRARVEAEADGLPLLRDAKTLYERRRHASARAAFETFLESHPTSCFAPTARYYRARLLSFEGRATEARDAFAECIERDTGVSGLGDEAQMNLGIAHFALRADAAAIEHLRRFVELHPHSTEQATGWLWLGRALRRAGDLVGARAALEAVDGARGAREGTRRAARRELARLAAEAG
jgi:tetratricopeptide (TPR) repeat protein